MFDSLILDIDGTIYDYDKFNKESLQYVFEKISSKFGIESNKINEKYGEINKKIKLQNNYSQKHNKEHYFIELFKELNLDLIYAIKYYDAYKSMFFETIEMFPGLVDFLNYCKSQNIIIILVSNNTLVNQISILKHFKIHEVIDEIITTDIFGEEKPNDFLHSHIMYVLEHKFKKQNPIIVGDNFEHDIEPFQKYQKYFCCHKTVGLNLSLSDKNYIEFSDYVELKNLVGHLIQYSNEYIHLSKLFGQDIINTQGPGGNISIKQNDILMIKSSGSIFGNVKTNSGYCLANNNIINQKLEINKNIDLIEAKISGDGKPSMEGYFHSFLKKYVIHLHFIPSNICFCSKGHDLENFKYRYEVIDYLKPGLEISREIYRKYNKQDIFFLKNHGLIFHSEDINKIYEIYEYLLDYFDAVKLGFDFSTYNINRILYDKYNLSMIIKKINIDLNNFQYLIPDFAIFVSNIRYLENLDEIMADNKIVVLKNNTYIISNSINKFYSLNEILLSYDVLVKNKQNEYSVIDNINMLNLMPEEIYRNNSYI